MCNNSEIKRVDLASAAVTSHQDRFPKFFRRPSPETVTKYLFWAEISADPVNPPILFLSDPFSKVFHNQCRGRDIRNRTARQVFKSAPG